MLLTDWNNPDPMYFYLRGLVWGYIFSTMTMIIIYMFLSWVRKRKNVSREETE